MYLEAEWIVDRISSKMASVSDTVFRSGRGLDGASYLTNERRGRYTDEIINSR